MCGICGFTGELEQRENVIAKMTEVITHRGPDSDGFFVNDDVAMGFRRLSIIDLETGDQPIENESGDLVITFNGEIYNYKDLKKELEALGHHFKTTSDTEVLLHAFDEWDEDMLQKLRGMFAFAIYNKKTNELFLARDFFGIKPLHYTMIGNSFVWASEIKSILEHPGFEKKFNQKALDAYLSFQYCPQPMTFFEGVYCLLPGHFLRFRNGDYETQRYFEPKFKPDNEMSEDQAVDMIESVFEDSVNAHKIADVEVGCFLSSGVDSSYVSTYFKDQKTFTVGFDFGEHYNEIDWAKNLSEKIGVDHYTKLISTEEFWAAVPKVQYHMDQPLADPSCVALYFVAKLASEHVKVVLSGEGADELFGGYTIYNDPRVFKIYQKIVPYFLRRGLCWIAKKLPDIKGRDYVIRATHPLQKRFIGNAYMYDEKQKKALLKDPSIATDPSRLCRRLYTRARRYDDETKMQYLDINMWMVGDILLKADRMSMANSLELRVPFLDKEVFKVASKLPTDLRVNKFNTKYAMRKAAARHLPEEVAEKEKLGFPVPTRVWLRNDHYYGVVKDMFLSPTAEKFFNTDILISFLDDHYTEKEDNSRKIWTIYVFLVWYQLYFGAVSAEDLTPPAPPEKPVEEPVEEAVEATEAEPTESQNEADNADEPQEAQNAFDLPVRAPAAVESPFEDEIEEEPAPAAEEPADESEEPADEGGTKVFNKVSEEALKKAKAEKDKKKEEEKENEIPMVFEDIFSSSSKDAVRVDLESLKNSVEQERKEKREKIDAELNAVDEDDVLSSSLLQDDAAEPENADSFFESLKDKLYAAMEDEESIAEEELAEVAEESDAPASDADEKDPAESETDAPEAD